MSFRKTSDLPVAVPPGLTLPAARQRGFVLVVALMILISMTLLGIALVRSVDTSTQVANNIGFKQSALASGDYGTEQAIVWIAANTGALTADAAPGVGYYATEQAGTDFTGQLTASTADDVDWKGLNGARRAFVVPGTDAAGNKVAYIIQRMCDQAGSYVPGGTIQCATSSTTVSEGGSKGGVAYGSYAITGKAMIYYRITSRVVGPRNTVSYVQSMVLVEY
jgi:Tfp pilus assembly protein PilX